ncbi:hypothetical protein WJX72_012489 [[Myrmecia] bisecta]|uniref:Uncharacterized protein n=1 Tax=[Myrmecia] bisecta TaxID=41462 RepID=A0AAW1P7X2_9CHLO
MSVALLIRSVRVSSCPLRLDCVSSLHSSTAAWGSVKPPGESGGQGMARTETADSQHDPDFIQNLKDTQGKAGTAKGGSHSQPDVRSGLSEAGQGDAGDSRGGRTSGQLHKSPPAGADASHRDVTSAEGDTGTASTTEKVLTSRGLL